MVDSVCRGCLARYLGNISRLVADPILMSAFHPFLPLAECLLSTHSCHYGAAESDHWGQPHIEYKATETATDNNARAITVRVRKARTFRSGPRANAETSKVVLHIANISPAPNENAATL